MSNLVLSVLDQSPIRQGGNAAQALRETVELAKVAERVGYTRFWVAEHHSTGTFAGTAPEILIGQIAAATKSIRVGSGGVMLSHYSALKVAEEFRILSAFFPGRIDLGIGRAPGSDGRTAVALAAPRPLADVKQFPQQVADVVGFLAGRLADDHQFAGIEAQPGASPDDMPQVWLLGSSDYSARLAAMLGLPFAFADFFGNAGDFGPIVAALYRNEFQPSDYLAEPKLSVALHVTCAETEERARFVASSMRLMVARMRTGHHRTAILPPESASAILDATDPQTKELVAGFTRHYLEGDPDQIRQQLATAAKRYETNDLTIAMNCYAFADRVRSFELIAETAGLTRNE